MTAAPRSKQRSRSSVSNQIAISASDMFVRAMDKVPGIRQTMFGAVPWVGIQRSQDTAQDQRTFIVPSGTTAEVTAASQTGGRLRFASAKSRPFLKFTGAIERHQVRRMQRGRRSQRNARTERSPDASKRKNEPGVSEPSSPRRAVFVGRIASPRQDRRGRRAPVKGNLP